VTDIDPLLLVATLTQLVAEYSGRRRDGVGDEVPGDAESTGKVNCKASSVVPPLLRPLSSAERQTTMSLD
jgi:hypothetical protein